MNKSYLFLLILVSLFLIPNVSANFILNPSQATVETVVGKETNFTLEIKNNFTQKYFNLKFESNSYISIATIPELDAGATINVTATVNPQQPVNGNQPIKFQGNFLTPVTLDPEQKIVSITGSGFLPQNIQIKKLDSIKWINNHDITHRVTEVNSVFDQSITAGSNFIKTFNDEGQVNYFDGNFPVYAGTITIVSNQENQLTHNNEDDLIFNLNLNANFEESQITLEIIDGENLTIPYKETGEGLIKIQNIGNSTARNITLTSDNSWISFSETNFDLSPSNSNFLSFSIVPSPTNTNDTDKNYEISIIADAINTASISKKINLYVPFKEITEEDLSKDRKDLLEQIKELQKRLEEAKGILESEGSINIQDQNITLNLTTQQFLAFLDNNARTREDLSRLIELMIPFADDYKSNLKPSLENISEATKQTQMTAEESKSSIESRNLVIGLVILGIVLVSGATYIFYNQRKKKLGDEKREV